MTAKKVKQEVVSAIRMREMNIALRSRLSLVDLKPKTLRTKRGLAYKILIEGSGHYRAEDRNYFSWNFALHIEDNKVIELYWNGPSISMSIASDNYVHVNGPKDIMQRFRTAAHQEDYKVRRALEIMHKRADIARMLHEQFVGVIEEFEESIGA